jgi:nucleotide-binding universal stress UspA family protein
MVKKILVPLDGSKLAEEALPYAEDLAQKFEAELILARVAQPMPVIPNYDGTAFYTPHYGGRVFYNEDLFLEQAEANLSKVYLSNVQHRLHYPARTIVIEGHPEAEAIIDMASRESVDLIVMSTHGRSGINRLVNGSVADEVTRRASCPTFLVKATEVAC